VPEVSSWTSPPPGADGGAEQTRAQSRPKPPQDEPPHPHHLHLPAGAHVVDRRGLTAAGAVTIALVLGFIGAAIDVNTGRGLRTVFAIFFIVGSALAAMLVHREDIKATVVMPPLTYCVLALIGAAIGHTQAAGSFVKSQGLELVSALILGAPTLYAATGSALLVALIRGFRSAQRP
jgi:hypothetical protein